MDEVGRSAQTALLVLAKNGTQASELERQYVNAAGSAEEMAGVMNDTAAGGLAAMRSALEGLSIEMGDVLSEAVVPMIEGVTKLASWVNGLSRPMKVLIAVVAGLAAAVGPVLMSIGLMSSGVAALSAAMSPITLTVLGVVAAIAALGAGAYYVYKNYEAFRDRFKMIWSSVKNGVIEAIAKIMDAHDRLLGPLGIGIFETAAAKIRAWKDEIPGKDDVTEFKSFGKTMKEVGDDVTGTFDKIKGGMTASTEVVKQKALEMTTAVKKVVEPIKEIDVSLLMDVVPEMPFNEEELENLDEGLAMFKDMQRQAGNVSLAVSGAQGAFEEMFSTMINGGQNAFQAVINYIKQLVVRLVSAVATAAILAGILASMGMGSFSNLFKSNFMRLSGFQLSGERAYGGGVSSSMPYLVGERGPELFIPGSSGSVISNNRLNSMGGSSSVTVGGSFQLLDDTLIAAIDRGSQKVRRINPGFFA